MYMHVKIIPFFMGQFLISSAGLFPSLFLSSAKKVLADIRKRRAGSTDKSIG